jgi:hypothetical protein
MKRSACPSSLAGKKPFLAPARAACQPRVASGDASRPPARRAAAAATALVKVHASEHPRDGNSEPTQLCGQPRTPLATILPGEKASVSTRKPFKPPVSKDSEMSEMYGSSDKVRLCTADPSPKCTNPSPRASPATQRLGAGPQKARLPRFSPHLEDALVLYTPPEEACSEDIKPKCGTRSMPRAPYPVPPPHPPPPPGCRPACRCAASARCTWCSTHSSASSSGRTSVRGSRCASGPSHPDPSRRLL